MDNRIFNYAINDGFLWSEVNIKGNRKFYIEGYASTIDKDKAGEIIDYTAQEDIYNQIQTENITLDLEHEQWYSDNGKILPRPRNDRIPVAKVVSAELREQGVWVKAEINPHLSKFTELWGSIRDGFLKAFSVAFYPTEKIGNVIKKLNLVNITLTGSPVNPNATFQATMKSAVAWMNSYSVEAPEVVSPSITSSENISSTTSEPQGIVKSMEENKMDEYKCESCDEKFEDKDKLEAHVKSCGKKAEVKAEEQVIDYQAEIKAIKEQHEAELKALTEKLDAAIKNHSDEVATLKAELEKPQLKAIVEETPKPQVEIQIVSPLKLVR